MVCGGLKKDVIVALTSKVWKAEDRQALLQQENANMAAELQASAEQHDEGA